MMGYERETLCRLREAIARTPEEGVYSDDDLVDAWVDFSSQQFASWLDHASYPLPFLHGLLQGWSAKGERNRQMQRLTTTTPRDAVIDAATEYERLHRLLDSRSDLSLGLAGAVNYADVALRNAVRAMHSGGAP